MQMFNMGQKEAKEGRGRGGGGGGGGGLVALDKAYFSFCFIILIPSAMNSETSLA